MTISRQLARFNARLAQKLCPKCPTGTLEINPRTQQRYTSCAACRVKKNDARRMGPRVVNTRVEDWR